MHADLGCVTLGQAAFALSPPASVSLVSAYRSRALRAKSLEGLGRIIGLIASGQAVEHYEMDAIRKVHPPKGVHTY